MASSLMDSTFGESLSDEMYMRLALRMAEGTMGQTGSNPSVGCVIVKDGRIIGLGAHLRKGAEHAEVHAMNMAGEEAAGATVYVTLEPCSHFGRTPPCCRLLASRGVRRVVIAALDPNPLVSGRGVQHLRENGIEVQVGVLAKEAERLTEMFRKYIVTRMPFVTLKTAVTLDGRIASHAGDSRWITGEEAREAVHAMRHRHQAIMVGGETVRRDNPRLTTRLMAGGLNPLRVVVDSRLELPQDSHVLNDGAAPTIVLTTEEAAASRGGLYAGAQAEIVPCGSGPQVDLRLGMKLLGEREIGSVLLEGGGRLNGAMLGERLVDKIVLFCAPKIIGGGAAAPSPFEFPGFPKMEQAIRLHSVEVQRFGDDVCIAGYPLYGGET